MDHGPLRMMLGVVHIFQHFHERTKRTPPVPLPKAYAKKCCFDIKYRRHVGSALTTSTPVQERENAGMNQRERSASRLPDTGNSTVPLTPV